jgi:hypothetical protein
MFAMLDILQSSNGEKSTIQPLLGAHSNVIKVAPTGQSSPTYSPLVNCESSEYREEKKECEGGISRPSSPLKTPPVDKIEPPTTLLHQISETPPMSYSTFHDSRDEGERIHGPVLVKTMSGPDLSFQEENSIMSQSFITFKSAPEDSGHPGTRNVIPVLKRTGTWDGVVSTYPIDPIGAVNSFISNTSAVVNDAATLLAEITNGDSNDMQESIKITDGSSQRGHSIALCHGDENIKAAVRGVLSHLSLSPRNKPQEVPESCVFLADSENKEFLQNYFYCTKRRDENDQYNESGLAINTSMERSGGSEHEEMDHSMAPAGIACTVEPCNAHETNCHLLGVDAVCSGFTYLFPKSNKYYDESSRSNGTTRTRNNCSNIRNRDDRDYNNHTNEAIQQVARQPTGSASFNQCKDYLASTSHHPSSVNLHDHHETPLPYSIRLGYGRRPESWLDMFQRVATSSTRRFSFTVEKALIPEDVTSSRHPFTPPCLTRRVLTKNQR